MRAKKKEQRRKETREAALAVREDVGHLRTLVEMEKPPTRAEVRRASAILRRLFIERDLKMVAAPRTGIPLIAAPDNSPFVHANTDRPFQFFLSGGARILGRAVGGIVVDSPPRRKVPWQPNAPVEKTPDGFSREIVLILRGRVLSRAAVIKYAANVAAGVHSGQIRGDDEKALAILAATSSLNRDGRGIQINSVAIEPPAEFVFTADSIDIVQYELLSAAHYLVHAPSIDELVKFIDSELGC